MFTLLVTACGGGSSSDPETPILVIEPPDNIPTEFDIATGPPPVERDAGNPQFSGEVMVTINAQLPENTPAADLVYLSGDFENWSGGGDPAYQFSPKQDGSVELSFTIDAGSTIQFKLTRGQWGTEEVSELGRTIANRVQVVQGQDIEIQVNVENWVDLSLLASNPYSGYWNNALLDFVPSEQKPKLTLIDGQTMIVAPNSTYVEPGVTAVNANGEDISDAIQSFGVVDTSVQGDYLVSYSVTDQQGVQAVPISRMVRVTDGETSGFSVRPVGSTHSHLGYMEQLPRDYGSDLNKRYPLLIYHHGGGGDAASVNDTPTNALLTVFSLGGGPVGIAMSGDWNTESPLIALSPQRSTLSPPNFERINGFVDFAIANYQIDPNRIYMTGHSQGGFVSWRYAVEYPDKVAAIAPLAGGFFAGGIPSNICDAAVVPTWAFHSIDDNVVSVARGREPIDLINQCMPENRARFTVFDGLGHQSHQYVLTLQGMGNALAQDDPFDENLYEWFMAQSISQRD